MDEKLLADLLNAKEIGTATLQADGTLELALRAVAPDGTFGEALLRVPPTDDRYEGMIEHLGGIKPGESKPVPPFPDEAP